MAAQVYPLTADKGATLRLSVRYVQPDGEPVDLTGWSARFARLPNHDGGPLSEHAASVGADGWITTVAADEVTDAWPTGKARYRLEVENPAGEVDYLLVGNLTVRGNDG